VDELKEKLCEELNLDIEEMGYISPGHKLKGKLNPLTSGEDLDDMYAEYKRKRADIMWCSTPYRIANQMQVEKKHPKKQMGKHVSNEVPPALPYFGKGVKRSKENKKMVHNHLHKHL